MISFISLSVFFLAPFPPLLLSKEEPSKKGAAKEGEGAPSFLLFFSGSTLN